MSRVVWPHAFVLNGAQTTVTNKPAESNPNFTSFKNGWAQYSGSPVAEGDMAVFLRWFTDPALGFPRQPFSVYFRPPGTYPFVAAAAAIQAVNGGTNSIGLGPNDFYLIRFDVTPVTGQSLLVEALDRRGYPLPGQRSIFTAKGAAQFRSPGIAGIRITGGGATGAMEGVNQTTFANDPKWVLVDTVGLPFLNNEIALPAYNALPQAPKHLSGFEASLLRLQFANYLTPPIPGTNNTAIPAPAWPHPTTGNFSIVLTGLNSFTGPRIGETLFTMIVACLGATNDTNAGKLQTDYVYTPTAPASAGLPGATPAPPLSTGTAQIPVVGITMLTVATDSLSATVLGYGTTHFPQGIARPGTPFDGALDYMVATDFTLPNGAKVEVAALVHYPPPPEAPASLTVEAVNVNRAPGLDKPATQAVRLKWALSTIPQGYGVVLSTQPGSASFLNNYRDHGSFDPIIPARPPAVDGELPVGFLTSYNAPTIPLPLAGTVTQNYLVIAKDVFDRFSPWSAVASLTAKPIPLQAPGLHSVTIVLGAGSSGAHIVPASLEIEFSWDWEDRSPATIRLSGKFFPAANLTPDPPSLGSFVFPGAASAEVIVKFNGHSPSIASGHAGSIEILNSTANPQDNDRVHYRLTLKGLSCNFTASPELAFEVHARAEETVRPNELSAVVGPAVGRVFDPTPPPPPALPGGLGWTALADATGRSRALLSWTPDPSAAGYNIWEATESALLARVSAIPTTTAPSGPLAARATALRALVTNAPNAAADAFSRLNTQPLTTASTELQLPAQARVIYAYRVTSVSQSGVESDPVKSSMALFAVPHRNVPPQPNFSVRRDSGGIRLLISAGTGAQPAAYRGYRVRQASLILDVGSMGPHKFLIDTKQLDNTTHLPVWKGEYLDPVPPSWYPYYYRMVAVGDNDPPNGEYGGESIASVVQQAIRPLPNPPFLQISQAAGPGNMVITLTTDLPIRPSPIGPAKIQVINLVADATGIKRVPVFSMNADLVPLGPPLVPLTLFNLMQQASQLPKATRSDPDSQGRFTMTILLNGVPPTLVTVADPLNRSTEASLVP